MCVAVLRTISLESYYLDCAEISGEISNKLIFNYTRKEDEQNLNNALISNKDFCKVFH